MSEEVLKELVEKVKELYQKNSDTCYSKWGSVSNDFITIFANAETEKSYCEKFLGISVEDAALISSLTEKQRSLIILQSEKEKIEGKIKKLLE